MKNRKLKKILSAVLSVALMFSMAACSQNYTDGDSIRPSVEENSPAQTNTPEEIGILSLREIPEAYLQPCDQAGQVVRLDYTTNTYDAEQRSMEKYAFVYLPYGYDETDEATKYPVFYLMHGWTGEAELYLGGEGGDRPLKRIFDRLIANGDMQPMIIVTPTYYKDNREQGRTVQEEDAILTANFYHELQNDLIPAVESRYHTYADTVDAQGIRASRDYRIFGGFSMGAVTTWYVFLNCLDSFRYYMPISGDCWAITKTDMGTEDTADETARYLNDAIQNSEYTASDYYIYALTGTDDTAHDALATQIEAMKKYSDSFVYSDIADRGNLFFQTAEGGVHNYTSMIQYIYNALPVFDKLMHTENV